MTLVPVPKKWFGMLIRMSTISTSVLLLNAFDVGGILNGIVTSNSVSLIAVVVVYEPSTTPKSAVVFSNV